MQPSSRQQQQQITSMSSASSVSHHQQQQQQHQMQQTSSSTHQRVIRTMEQHHVTRQISGSTTAVQGEQVFQQSIQGFGANAQPPVFVKVFSSARFAQGGTASFEGRVTGTPQPQVQWTRNGIALQSSGKHRLSYNPNTGDITLQILQIGPGDEGEYVCTAKNQYGSAICSVFIQPESFQTKSTSHKESSFQSRQISNAYANESIIREDFKVDTFEYRLLREVSFRESIARRHSTETAETTISTVVERSLGPVSSPQITQKPRNSKLLEGSDAVFSAKLSANPRPRVTWFHNGQRITQSQKFNTSFTNSVATLKVNNASAEDSGHYTLLAENPNGCIVSSAFLAIEPVHTHEGIIHESVFQEERQQLMSSTDQVDCASFANQLAPSFLSVCNDREVTEGKMTRFDCRVTGRPYPEVTWYINGRPMTDDQTHKILVNESGSHALMINNVNRSESGIVTCVARNKSGEISFQCQLNVLEKEQMVAPKFVERFTSVNVREGEPVLLNARAVGAPAPRITWQKDGVPLCEGPDIRIRTENGASSLDIARAKASDAAWYQCTAQNVAGSTATRARLFVETLQEPPLEQQRLHLPKPTTVIEPEPEPGPEIIYLRHVERARPHVPAQPEDRIYPPPQFIIPLRDVQQFEGAKVHFEARIEPVGDPSMRVEWLLNGKLMQASSRFTTVFRFGFIALDILSTTLHDHGEYVCRVTSTTGTAESKATLNVTSRASIEQRTQHPDSLRSIQQLEEYTKEFKHQESVEESTAAHKPHFIRPLQDMGELQEGRNAHLEAQLSPVSDPTMKVEWYKDGKPITASSRITTIFNFGYVSLNITHLRAEDAGSYTVRAVNRLGEAVSSSTLRVQCRSTVTEDLGIPEQQRYIEMAEQLEHHHQHAQQQKYTMEAPESVQAPEFKTPIKDQLDIREDGFAHFEARLEPIGDSSMRVEWSKDGRPVEASSRITSFFNFGYVALTIKDVTVRDVGRYTCRAINNMGEATTTAQLGVVSKKNILFESQHPGGLEKIQYLEDSTRYSGRTEADETVIRQPPRFLGPLKGTNKIVEGQRAHFEARVEPQSDLTLNIEWYYNGQPIQSANRIQTYHDFGYVAIDILNVREQDSGTYTVVARNSMGEAQSSASMTVETRANIDTRSMHRGAYDKTKHLEASKFVEPHYHIEELCKSKPVFVVPLSDPQPISEGRNVHLECRLEPMGDPTMRVEWFCNGRPVTVGSRFRTYYDFGFVALDIIHATALDSGEYTVRAVNQLGSDHTSACVRVLERTDIITDTQHEQSLEQIQLLEQSSAKGHHQLKGTVDEVTVQHAPQFTRSLHNIETVEGTNIHMECRLQPIGDPTMRVDWFVNGMPVKTGHRFRPAYDFDYVALDLLSVYPCDSGVYTCQARNELGEAVTSCAVRVLAKKDILLESQHPSGLEKIHYLEDASRYKRTEFADEQIRVKPRFVTKPKNLDNMMEGKSAHFECKLEPVTDPNLKVEWFKNGRPITVGHRFRPIHDFGYVALDIVDLIAEDSATYTCRATNMIGVDETSCTLKCRPSTQIITATQNEEGLEQIHYLEDRAKHQQRKQQTEDITTQAPIFTTSLANIEIKESQRAHFECRLIPVSDPTMKIEWFHNGRPLKSGSRFTETNNFGFVALDILYAYPEDSGTYTCRAKNVLGEAVTSSNCVVHSKKSIYLESVHVGALERLAHLEDSSRRQKQSTTDEVFNQAPVFTLPIKNLQVAENQAAHFEARLIPVGDPRLQVEWLRNGIPIQASNRLTTMHDFGYVALNMKYVNPEDSGTYTCRAVNDLGEAITSATLVVQSKASLELESQHMGALKKLRQLETSTKYHRKEEEETITTQAPKFVAQLNGPASLNEGQSAHYECRIEPYPDPTMKVEWYLNNKPITAGHRFRTAFDFGFASLDVLTVYAEDSGEYTCRVINAIGEAKSSVNTTIKSKSSIILDTQHEGALQKIKYLEHDSKYKKADKSDAVVLEKPQFGRGLKNIENLSEGASAHLKATLTPVNDPTMRVEWFCNGRPIKTGHRFKSTYDFGFVALDILYSYAEDSGTYMCRARNAAGEAATTAVVSVNPKAGLYLDTLDEQRLQKIRELEKFERPKKEEIEAQPQRPVFLTPLVSLENVKENEHAHLECRIEPIHDPNLKIEWFCNGVKLRVGHRFRTTHDFGYVALDILYAYPEDSGTYICKATNLAGEAVNTCTIKVGSRNSILLDTQHPEGLVKIRELEAQGHPAKLEVEEPTPMPPRFVTELRGPAEVVESQTAHFEAQVEPIHDPNLRIEFYHNNKPLPSASRFHITFDFGYVSLDITHAVPEDAGEYSVKAINNMGQCVSATSMKVIAKSNIISESQRPEGMDKIRQLEQQQPYQRPAMEEAITRQRPVFTQPLQNIDSIAEAQTAHFECRLIPVGDPTLKVEWFRNEKPLEDSSRITKVHDFGLVSLDIAHVRDEDAGVYICRASNPLGEAVTTASMKIQTKASIQLETQHPEAQRKIQLLEQTTQQKPAEPERQYEKPIFTQLLTGPTELWEGQHAHYEARVVPVGDPRMRFEWFVNGVELKLGSRSKVSHDFGFVTLDIMSTTPDDSGIYMCKAINDAGEAVSSISMRVKSKANIMGEPIQPDAWQQIQLKEAALNKVPEMFVDTTPQQPPVFTTHLQSFDKLIEGQHVYLKAQIEPRADPNLHIEWFKNGIPLNTGTRLKSTFDFGLVTLSINGLRDDDSAIYTCKATNRLGEAISTCTLKIEDRHWLLGQTLHPAAIPKLEALEHPTQARSETPDLTYELPIFITHLNNVECLEGDNVHFECNVEPSKDPTLRIEWFVNGKPLATGSKYKTTYDFGYVALDITHTYEHESGIYTCKATNSKGSATTSGSLRVTPKQDIYRDTQHPQGKAGLDAVEDTEHAIAAKYQRKSSDAEAQYRKPQWTTPLNPEFKLLEGQPLHLEGTVEPKEDPNLKIEWFFNGKSLDHGTRFKLTSDFGFVTLDLTDVYERDQGIYTCKASNKAGEAFTSTTVYCATKASLIERTQHPRGQEGLEKIQDLEDSLHRPEMRLAIQEEGHAPVFTSEFTDLNDLNEGDIAHVEAGLTPIGDQTMRVEWFYNGQPIEASHRFRTVHAFGMVVLEILGCKIEDSGTYTCRATNKWGQAELSVHMKCVEKIKGQKPKFTTHIKDIVGLKDGQSAHFECTLTPVNDPCMKVEWYHNGQPILQSSRIKAVSDFGFVVMDISYVQDQDSGEYVCRAWNKYGEDFTKATISASGRGGVLSDTLQPDSLARIRELESLQRSQGSASPIPVNEPPKFLTQIQDTTRLIEGQSAHFEARLVPVTDPDLVVEWYYNGKKLPHGHRYRTFHDFGIVILDILYCYEENSGVYECRARNKFGEDSTNASLKCTSKANLILDSQLPKSMEGGLQKIQNLEDSLFRKKEESITEEKGRAPVFTVPLANIDSLREGENSHFEARLTPVDDPKLTVEWYWNGRPLKTGSRFRTFCDFGFVILEISPVYPEDSGEYSCRAFNEYGEAVTTSTMKVQGKRSIILESQLPKGMEGTIDKIAELEGLSGTESNLMPEDDTGKPPEFITTPADLTLGENSLAHFECRLMPINDPSMRVEWFHNGKPLWAGSRIKTINDFGFVILEMSGIYQRDSGMYTCKATNRHGEATVSCRLQVRGRQGIILEPQLPSNFRSGTESIQKLEETLHKKDEIMSEEEQPNPPQFIVDIKDNENVPESGPVHFDCRLKPVNDPTMRIDWFHNNRPFATGSRVHQVNDFGYISLDIDYIYARDAGEYVCRATNKWGTAMTKAKVTTTTKRTIDYESQLPAGMSAEKLKELERGPAVAVAPKEDKIFAAPKFITHIQSVTVEETETVRFECRVEPKDDPRLRIEWYRNGKPLPSGHRYKTVYDMGFVALDILSVYSDDAGEYVCRAVNDFGEDFTKAKVTCKRLPNIILQNQVPKGMKRSETLMQMEAAIKKYTSEVHLTEDDLYDIDKKQPPRFVTQIQNQESLVEMETTKFECQLAPVGDPNMKVEWFFNGKPLPHKNRFTPIYDFGYVAMNFGWVYPEDSGEYLCRATNLYGMDKTRAVIKTTGKPGIIYESQLPKGMKSIEKIREMEAAMQSVPEELNQDGDAKARSAPVFVSKPEACIVEEGEWARFCCRVTGHPKPRVMWLVNGHTVVNGSRYKLVYDGMYHLDIPKTRQYDTGKVEVIARSSVGEAIASTELKVIPRHDDYRGVLKSSPRPWYDLDLAQYQKEREATELERILDERNTTLKETGLNVTGAHAQLKDLKESDTEWQQLVKQKKSDEYYNRLQELENDQLTKEIKLRESAHQFAIPGEKVVSNSLARGMAHKYQESLEQTQEEHPHKVVLRKIQRSGPAQQATPHPHAVQLRKTEHQQINGDEQQHNEVTTQKSRGAAVVEPSASGVHGREVHTLKQKQVQREQVGDTEITRNITTTETTDVEHKANVEERFVDSEGGQMLPSNPPIFTKKIQPCLVFENASARFEVEFDGDPLPKITWYREDFPITSSPDLTVYTFSTKSILVMRQAFVEDSGVFSVVAENRGGTAKCSANLVVQERRRQDRSGGPSPPSFITTIQSINATVGQLVRFDARVNGTKPIDVYWLKNGKKITPDIRYKTLVEDDIHTLLIIEVVLADAATYECVAINNAGEARCEAQCVVDNATKTAVKTAAPANKTTVEKAPLKVEGLTDQTVPEGGSVVFQCRVTGKPVPIVKWQKGNQFIKQSKYFQMFNEDDLYTLRISEAFPEDEGTYRCVATNSMGNANASAALKVTMPENQEVTPTLTPIKDVIVTEGSPAQFKTTVSGKPKPSIQWLREGYLIPESTDFQMIHEGNNAILLIATTYEEDSGRFTCRATSSAGQVEQSAKLIVNKNDDFGIAPYFTQPLKQLTVPENSECVLECTVQGQPYPNIKWYRNHTDITEECTYEEKTGITRIRISSVKKSRDQAKYKIVAENQFGKAETRAKLIISEVEALESIQPIAMEAPTFLQTVSATLAQPDENIELEAIFNGTPTPNIKWLRNNQLIQSDDNYKLVTNNRRTTLRINKKATRKSGKYEVVATNEAGEAKCSATVSIATPSTKSSDDGAPPVFVQPIQSQVANEGDVVIVEAEVKAHPVASFQWLLGSQPITSTAVMKIATEENCSTLVISDVTAQLAGPITCRAENALGSVTCTATLSLVSPQTTDDVWERVEELEQPRFVKRINATRVMDGEKMTLKCTVRGKPIPKVEWFCNQQPIQEAKHVTCSQHKDGSCKLTITEVFPENAGTYTCIATNKLGRAVCEAPLIVESYEYVPDSESTQHTSSEDDTTEVPTVIESAPQIIKELPEVVKIDDGQIVKFEAKATGVPKPTSKWYKQGEEIQASPEFIIENLEDGTSILTIPDLYPDDVGTISFEAQNPLGVAVTTAQLVIDSTESILDTKEYRKPEWVTHMEELQVALKASQSPPTFVLEIKDIHTTEAERAVFECQFSGTPSPGILWYHNDKIIRNTDNVRIRIDGQKTTCTIEDCSTENGGQYVCKATSDIGMAITKAKLHVQTISADRKQEIRLKRAKELEEKITKERVKVEKMKSLKKRKALISHEEHIQSAQVQISEVTTVESTQELVQETATQKPETATPVLDTQVAVKIEATATCKKIDDDATADQEYDIMKQAARPVISPQEPMSLQEVQGQENVDELNIGQVKSEAAIITDVQQPMVSEFAHITEIKLEQVIERVERVLRQCEIKMAKEVSEMLNFIRVGEFGPGEHPLKEIAEIAFLLKNGISTTEVTVLYHENKFPSLKTPQAQSALVNVVERKGHSAIISEILTEETTSDERKLAATVGFRALMKLVENKHVAVEEVITSFVPEDFIQRAWESVEATETITKSTFGEMVTIVEEAEIIEDTSHITERVTGGKKQREDDQQNSLEPPMFVERFEGMCVQPKDTIRLLARVIGNPVPEVMWLHDNQPVETSERVTISYDGETAVLLINEADLELDAGDYKCAAANKAGKNTHGATIKVGSETVFAKHLRTAYEAAEHSTIELECETSHCVPTQWHYNDEQLNGMDHRVVVQDGCKHKLIIKKATKRDEGNYRCSTGTAASKTVLKVQTAKAEFVRKLCDMEVTELEETILEVELSSASAEVQWLKDGKAILLNQDKYEQQTDGCLRKLLVRRTSIHDEGEYVCVLNDIRCSAEVTVIELPPEILTPLRDQDVRKAEKAVFEIEFTKGDALARWFKDDIEIQFSEHVQLAIDGKRQKLKIYNVQQEDLGEYCCKVGTQQSKAHLRMSSADGTAYFVKELSAITTVEKNKEFVLEVELSTKQATETWYRNSEVITQSDSNDRTTTIRKLTIREEEEVEYSCTVGCSRTTTKIRLVSKPSAPRGPLEVSGMSATSFTLAWQASEHDGGSPIQEYMVEIKEMGSSKPFKKLGSTKGNATNIACNYLEKDHGYQFRIYARNESGWSEAYAPNEVITVGSRITTPSPPLDVKINEVQNSTVKITWSAPSSDGGAPITGYVLEQKLDFMPHWERVGTAEADLMEFTFRNLKENSDYIFKVYAENSVGLSAGTLTELVHLQMNATAPSSPSAPLEIRTIGPNAVVVAWGLPEWDGGSPITGYNIAIKDTKKTMWMEVGRVGKGVHKFTIKDLVEGHDYMIRIFAKNKIGLSDPLETEEPFKIMPSTDTDRDDDEFREATDREGISYSTETTTSWLRENNMDADIYSYSKGKLLRKDEYFFRIWCYAKKLFD